MATSTSTDSNKKDGHAKSAAEEFILAFERCIHARVCEHPTCVDCDLLWRAVGHWHDIAFAKLTIG